MLDIAGWFGPGGLRYQPLTPTRLVDTRTSSPTAPSSPTAVGVGAASVLNVTAADATRLGWLAAKPCGATDTSSIVNSAPGESAANLTVVTPDPAGTVCVSAYRPTHEVVDLVGQFVP